MTSYMYSKEDLTTFANEIKETLLETMGKDGHINKDYEELCTKYILIINSKGMFGKLWDKLTGLKTDELRVTVLKSR